MRRLLFVDSCMTLTSNCEPSSTLVLWLIFLSRSPNKAKAIITAFCVLQFYFVHSVDLVPMHDVSICGGMKAHYTCTVNTSYLQWFINEVPINVVFNNETTVGKNFSVDGSVFVFTNASQVSGKIIYISTASLNILQTTKVSCADATANSEAHTVNLIGKLALYSFLL